MQFNEKLGKELYLSQIGVKKNVGEGTDIMRNRFNSNLRNKPKDATQAHLERQNKMLRDALAKARK